MSVLITGGTGFFGRAFVKHLLANGRDRICVYSRDEWKQAQMRLALNDDPRIRWFVGDVRDRERLTRAMHGVHVVVHAAALKRIEVGHYNPDEMVKTNVLGAMNVIDAAMSANVMKVVALSTDKAFEPVSAYGVSKAMGEQLFLASNNMRGHGGPIFAVTRYGNVAGSTGSIIPLWRQMIANGATTVPVTDPECTRFWMTAQEAVELVWRTMNTMQGGELNIPTLPAYRVGDLAAAMGVKMQVTGLGEWEKCHESMKPGMSSDKARRMSVNEIREALKHVE